MANLNEIKCPNCGEVFQVDESLYADIVQQVRTKEFEKELNEKITSQKEMESVNRALAISNATKELEKMLETANSKINALKLEKERAVEDAKKDKEIEINNLKSQLNNKETEKELAVTKIKADLEKKCEELKSDINGKNAEFALKEKDLRERFSEYIKKKDEEIAYYRDYKARLSTKMVGESLERHCEEEFNKLRMSTFPKAYFEKDNDARTGSKGDYIYRDFDQNGNEMISIMFEMKNENDTTATKHKNEDFFKELDKDRKEKKCEYAVLVSLLEMDSEYYNTGIVDVSYRYEKMYVIRPQMFITLITILKNAAERSSDMRNELVKIREQNIDITNFENSLLDFQDKFGKNYDLAKRHFEKAIEEIDVTIKHLEKVKESLMGSERQLRIANDKAQEISIKKLTKNNPTMTKMFDDLKNQG